MLSLRFPRRVERGAILAAAAARHYYCFHRYATKAQVGLFGLGKTESRNIISERSDAVFQLVLIPIVFAALIKDSMAETTIAFLQRNDPHVSDVTIELRDHVRLDTRLAQALSGNSYITKIRMYWRSYSSDWNALLQEIATRGNLQELILVGGPGEQQTHHPLDRLLPFLRAAQRNQSIGYLELKQTRLGDEDIAVLATATSWSRIRFEDCEMEEAAAQQLATVLQGSTTIQTLELFLRRNGNFVVPALRKLSSNGSVQNLVLCFHSWESGMEEASRAIQHLFESTTTIERVELLGYASLFYQSDLLRPVVDGLIASGSITDITLGFPFAGAGVPHQIHRILNDKENLRSLGLQDSSFGRHQQLYAAVNAALLRPRSSLRSLNILEDSLALEIPDLRALLQAVSESKLDRFSLGVINSRVQVNAITSAIPSMRVQHIDLHFGIDSNLEQEAQKEELLQALEQNYNVQSVTGTQRTTRLSHLNLFDEDPDRNRVANITDRNTCVAEFAGKPDTVNRAVWPELLSLAEKAGPDTLFRSVRSVLGNGEFGTSQSKRKRKRPCAEPNERRIRQKSDNRPTSRYLLPRLTIKVQRIY